LAGADRRAVAPRLRLALDSGQRRIVPVVAAQDVAVLDDAARAPLDPDGMLLCTVNTPDDYERARRHARRSEPLA